MIKHNDFWLQLILADKITIEMLLDLMKTFHASFKEMQKELPVINKESIGKSFNNGTALKYADWSLIQEKTAPFIAKHGFTIEQSKTGSHDQRYLTTIIKHDCGYFEEHHCPMVKLDDNGTPQEDGGDITYYKRYAYVTLLKLSTPDVDPDSATNNSPKDPHDKPKPGCISKSQVGLFHVKSKGKPKTKDALFKHYGITDASDIKYKDFNQILALLDESND